MLLGGGSQDKEPLDETFMDMLRFNICPQLAFYSFAVIFSFILVGMFFVQVGVDGIDRQKISKEFLPINDLGVLTGNLSDNYDEIRNSKQIWRFLTSLVIHKNAYHLFTNMLSLIIWASYFETFISSKRMSINFFIAGNLIRDTRKYLQRSNQRARFKLNGSVDRHFWNFRSSSCIFDFQLAEP
jgi:membrane associated rhomboid family serine protease